MISKCPLSNNTKAYIERFECILNEMIDQMSSVSFTESISGNFIVQMIPHHKAAIEMSENLLLYTTNIPLQDIAKNIITSQQKSIENMMAVCPKCMSRINSSQDLACYQKPNERIIKNMFHEMSCACVSNHIDANFMREMIPHHMGAVCMSENALRFSICTELVPLLEAIILSQKKGIREMQQLLAKINC